MGMNPNWLSQLPGANKTETGLKNALSRLTEQPKQIPESRRLQGRFLSYLLLLLLLTLALIFPFVLRILTFRDSY